MMHLVVSVLTKKYVLKALPLRWRMSILLVLILALFTIKIKHCHVRDW